MHLKAQQVLSPKISTAAHKTDYKEYDGKKKNKREHSTTSLCDSQEKQKLSQNLSGYNEIFPKLCEREGCFLKNMNRASIKKWCRADVNSSRTIKVSILAVFVEISSRKS
ncbi:hypothetical protein Y032_0143g2434 [Ancylostoma ceylanicum]|uniref:Uncharacterized protein n=1 Tax=Ancylostoma ceylanicum TaxID=53326 RepID=A0A016T2H4_9BILA|nr:hypothetical protein Y032_0143g2434 [Ancylostoma ceylanicum]